MAQGTDLRPRTVGEMLDGSFFLYRRHFGRFLLAATIVSIPTLIVAAVTAETAAEATRLATERIVKASGVSADPFAQLRETLNAQLSLIPLALLQTVLQALSRGGAIAVLTVATVLAVNREKMQSWGTLLRRAAPRMPAAVLAVLIQNLIVTPLLCCFPLAVLVAVFLAPMAPLIVLERGGIELALRRRLEGAPWLMWPFLPFAQVLDSFGRSFGLSLHAGSLARGSLYFFFVWSFVTLFVSGVSLGASSVFDSQNVLYWLQYYLEVLFLPSIGIATALWTLDLRARREGADLLSDRVALA